MARIDWAIACDHAFLDRQDRLCTIGILRSLDAPALPLVVPQVMLVGRLVDITPIDEIDVAVGMVSPSGFRSARVGAPCVHIEVAREYVLATLRDLTLAEGGIHHFQMRLRGQPIVSLAIPVVVAVPAIPATVQ